MATNEDERWYLSGTPLSAFLLDLSQSGTWHTWHGNLTFFKKKIYIHLRRTGKVKISSKASTKAFSCEELWKTEVFKRDWTSQVRLFKIFSGHSAHRNHSVFCNLRSRCPSQTPDMVNDVLQKCKRTKQCRKDAKKGPTQIFCRGTLGPKTGFQMPWQPTPPELRGWRFTP